MGPLQFLPSTWAAIAARLPMGIPQSPNNVFGAATAAAAYLCQGAGPEGMGTQSGLAAAYMSYNHSSSYVASALALAASFTSASPGPGSISPPAAAPQPTAVLPFASQAQPALPAAEVASMELSAGSHT